MKKDRAAEIFRNGFNCGQAVFISFAEECGISRDMACKLATGLGGGVARHGEICGAVSAGVLVLSSIFGRAESDGPEKMETTYSKTAQLFQKFREKRGSVNCSTLLNGCDLLSKEGRYEFCERGFAGDVCIPCVETAVEIVETLIKEGVSSENY